MNITNTILNSIVAIALAILTGNIFLGLIGAYGFHKGRLAMQKRNTKTEKIEEQDMTIE